MNKPISNIIIKQVLTIIIISGLGLLIFFYLSDFIPSFLGAITFYVLFRTPFLYLIHNKKWKKLPATLLIMLSSFLLILFPATLLVELTYSKVLDAFQYMDQIKITSINIFNRIKTEFNVDLLSADSINKITEIATKALKNFLNSAFSYFTIFTFAYFILYFMLMSNVEMEKQLLKFLPFKHVNTKKIGEKVYKIVLSNTIGIPFVALIQGIVGLIGYAIIGINDIWFWFAVTTFASMIPVVGAALAYIPLAVLLFTYHQDWKAVIVLLYGIIIIGSVDNICRFMFLKKMENIHPIITVFGVILGIKLFGFLGLIFGPLIICLFILLLEVYNNEYTKK